MSRDAGRGQGPARTLRTGLELARHLLKPPTAALVLAPPSHGRREHAQENIKSHRRTRPLRRRRDGLRPERRPEHRRPDQEHAEASARGARRGRHDLRQQVRVTVGYNNQAFAAGQGTSFGEANFPQPRFDVYLDNTLKATLKGTEANTATIDNVPPGSHKIAVVALNVSGEVIDRKEVGITTTADDHRREHDDVLDLDGPRSGPASGSCGCSAASAGSEHL